MDTIIPPDATPLKRCPACSGPEENKWHPATPEFFPIDNRNRNGLGGSCRQCCYARKKQAYHASVQVRSRYAETNKQWYESHKEQATETRMRYRRSRKEWYVEYQSFWYESHKEQVAEYGKQYHARPDVKEQCRAYRLNRLARQKLAPGSHTQKEIREQYERQKGKCYYCHHKVTWGKHHVDHVVPLSRGGSNDISNLVISCPTCNLKKHNRLPHEFPEGNRLL